MNYTEWYTKKQGSGSQPIKNDFGPFRDSYRKQLGQARRLLKDGELGDQLFKTLRNPYFYSCHAERLGLPPSCARPEGIFDPVMIERWKRQLTLLFERPLFAALEVGGKGELHAGRMHAHVVAERNAGLLHLARDGEPIKAIGDTDEDRERLLAYLHKNLPDAPELVRAYRRATLSGRRVPLRRWFWLLNEES